VSDDEASQVELATTHYPLADITPGEFETWVVEIFKSAAPTVSDLVVTLHETVVGVDGTYALDATVRYQFAGMKFLVVVDAKRHRNPINR
jgi:hypothetical protein